MKKNYMYSVTYASGILRNNGGNQNQDVFSNKKLTIGEYIVVEHKDCGIFIGKVKDLITELSGDVNPNYYSEYFYVKKIDLDNWDKKIRDKKRKEELKIEMEKKFAEIDKRKKYEYYAQIDDDFRDMYLEYSSLGGVEDEEN